MKVAAVTTEMPEVARHAIKMRQRRVIAELDYKRDLRVLIVESGYSQHQVSRWLGIAQPSVSQACKEAVPLPRPGFSGASPYEVCQRYAAGDLDREQVIDELARWEYAASDKSDGYDTILVDPPGTFDEVVEAADRGLLEDDVYDAIIERRQAKRRAKN